MVWRIAGRDPLFIFVVLGDTFDWSLIVSLEMSLYFFLSPPCNLRFGLFIIIGQSHISKLQNN